MAIKGNFHRLRKFWFEMRTVKMKAQKPPARKIGHSDLNLQKKCVTGL